VQQQCINTKECENLSRVEWSKLSVLVELGTLEHIPNIFYGQRACPK